MKVKSAAGVIASIDDREELILQHHNHPHARRLVVSIRTEGFFQYEEALPVENGYSAEETIEQLRDESAETQTFYVLRVSEKEIFITERIDA